MGKLGMKTGKALVTVGGSDSEEKEITTSN